MSGCAIFSEATITPLLFRNPRIICPTVSMATGIVWVSTYGLPEDEENDKFDGQDLDQRRIFRNILLDLIVELDQAVHCE